MRMLTVVWKSVSLKQLWQSAFQMMGTTTRRPGAGSAPREDTRDSGVTMVRAYTVGNAATGENIVPMQVMRWTASGPSVLVFRCPGMPETPLTAEPVTTMPLEMDSGVTWESAYWVCGLATGPVSALMAPMRAGLVNQRLKMRQRLSGWISFQSPQCLPPCREKRFHPGCSLEDSTTRRRTS